VERRKQTWGLISGGSGESSGGKLMSEWWWKRRRQRGKLKVFKCWICYLFFQIRAVSFAARNSLPELPLRGIIKAQHNDLEPIAGQYRAHTKKSEGQLWKGPGDTLILTVNIYTPQSAWLGWLHQHANPLKCTHSAHVLHCKGHIFNIDLSKSNRPHWFSRDLKERLW
jgi:hypothetical protein